MKPLTKTQRDVLRRMADGWQLVERVYESCYLIAPEQGAPITVRISTLDLLVEAGCIATADNGSRRTYALTDAGRSVLVADAPPAGGN